MQQQYLIDEVMAQRPRVGPIGKQRITVSGHLLVDRKTERLIAQTYLDVIDSAGKLIKLMPAVFVTYEGGGMAE